MNLQQTGSRSSIIDLNCFVQTAQKTREITIDEQIASLRENRQILTSKKELVEKQIRELDIRIEDRKQKGIDNNSK